MGPIVGTDHQYYAVCRGLHAGSIRSVHFRSQSLIASSGLQVWWLVCNQNGMRTGEVVLAIGILAAIAIITMLAAIRRRRRTHAGLRDEGCKPDNAAVEDPTPATVPDLGELLRQTLCRDLALAAEHVHSIRWLLEIARQHQQPIPTAALTNLDLVSKHLGEMRRRIEAAGGETATESPVSALAHRQEIQSPLHPRPPSFECHVSPSDISMPCD